MRRRRIALIAALTFRRSSVDTSPCWMKPEQLLRQSRRFLFAGHADRTPDDRPAVRHPSRALCSHSDFVRSSRRITSPKRVNMGWACRHPTKRHASRLPSLLANRSIFSIGSPQHVPGGALLVKSSPSRLKLSRFCRQRWCRSRQFRA